MKWCKMTWLNRFDIFWLDCEWFQIIWIPKWLEELKVTWWRLTKLILWPRDKMISWSKKVSFSGQSNAQYFDGSKWISFNNLNHELLESCASFYANDDTKAIVTGGIDFEGVLFDKVWIFDFLERTYSLTTQKLPKAIAGHSCTSVQLYSHDIVSTKIFLMIFFFITPFCHFY